jgi:hypothetical protein
MPAPGEEPPCDPSGPCRHKFAHAERRHAVRGESITPQFEKADFAGQFVGCPSGQIRRIVRMVKEHSTHSWLGTFAMRLIQLRPRLSIGYAVTCAVSSIHCASEIDPRRAAEIYLQANPIPKQAASRRATRRVSAPASGYRAFVGSLFSMPSSGARWPGAYAGRATAS